MLIYIGKMWNSRVTGLGVSVAGCVPRRREEHKAGGR